MLVWDSTSVLEVLLLGCFGYEGDVGDSLLFMFESRLLLLFRVEDIQPFWSRCCVEPCRLLCGALPLITAADGAMGPLLSFPLLCWCCPNKFRRPFFR